MADTAGSVALRLDDLHKSFGRTDIIRGVTLDVKQQRIGLVLSGGNLDLDSLPWMPQQSVLAPVR